MEDPSSTAGREIRNCYEITCARLRPFWPFSGRGSKPGYTLRVQFSRVAHVAAEAISDGMVSYGVQRLADALKAGASSRTPKGYARFS